MGQIEQERGEEMHYRMALWASLKVAEDEYRARVGRIEQELCDLTCGDAGRASWGCPIHMRDFEENFDRVPSHSSEERPF